MSGTHAVAAILWTGITLLGSASVCSQSYPNKPIRIVASAAASTSDMAARLVAEGFARRFGQPAVVDNRGTGIIPGEIVSRAAPDGYTLLLGGTVIWLTPFLQAHAPFDPVKDFVAISLLVTTPNVMAIHPSLPATTVKEFISLARSKPGAYNYGSTGSGSSLHVAGELFNAMAGVNIVRVPYKASAQAFTDLFSGRLQLMFPTAPAGMQNAKSGKLRALAVTSAQPSALAPGLITVAASGLPGYESGSILGMFAPARTPAKIVNLLNQEVVSYINTADVKEQFFNAGMETVGSSTREFSGKIISEMTRMGKVLRAAGIRSQQ